MELIAKYFMLIVKISYSLFFIYGAIDILFISSLIFLKKEIHHPYFDFHKKYGIGIINITKLMILIFAFHVYNNPPFNISHSIYPIFVYLIIINGFLYRSLMELRGHPD